MDTDKWLRYFEGRCARTSDIPWEEALPARDPGHEAMRMLLPQLSVGESTEGDMGEDLAAQSGDEGYARCLRAYSREEVGHGEIFQKLCQRYGVQVRGKGDAIIRFLVWLVNFGPLLARVVMLYTAEIVAVVMYERLRHASPDRVMRFALQSILDDERGHIAFHGDRLREALRQAPRWRQWGVVLVHRVSFALLCSLLYWENREVFRAYGVWGFSDFLEDCRDLRDQSATGVLGVMRGPSSGPSITGPTAVETFGN